MEKHYYPPKLPDAEVLRLMGKRVTYYLPKSLYLAKSPDKRQVEFTYVYGILVQKVGEFACEDGPHPKWQVGSRDNLTTDEAVAAVQSWMACGREEVGEDHWSVKPYAALVLGHA